MEARATVLAHEDEVLFFRTLNTTADLIFDHNGHGFDFLNLCFQVIVVGAVTFALELEPDCAVFFVSAPRGCEFLKIFVVNWLSLTLEVGAVIAAHVGALIPIHPHPLHSLE